MAKFADIEKRPRVVTIGNEKGGVGKTSIIRLLPTVLARRGYRCLVIDLDTQANTTKTFFITREQFHDDEVTVFEKTLMKGVSEGSVNDLIINVMPNLDFIPSAVDFESFPVFLSKKFGLVEKGDPNYAEVKIQQYSYFKKIIDDVKDEYDFVFFDTPPTVSDFSKAAAFASDYVVVAFQTQDDSLDGAVKYINITLTELVEEMGANIEILGVLPNQMTKGGIDRTVVNDAIDIFGEENLFSKIIPFVKAIQNVPRDGIDDGTYWNKRMFTEVFNPLAREFVARIAWIEG